MWGGCHPLREPLPFGPVIDALRSADLHIDSRAKLSAATAGLAPYLPAVAWQLPKDERIAADPETGGERAVPAAGRRRGHGDHPQPVHRE